MSSLRRLLTMEHALPLHERLFRFSPTALFYALWLSSLFLPNMHPALFPDGANQIGEASMQGIDIADRVAGIYRFIFFFPASWMFANFIFSQKFFQPHSLYHSFNSTISKAGCVQVIAGLFVPALLPLASLFAAVHIGIFISGKLPRKSVHTLSAPLAAAWTLIFWLNLIWWLPEPLPAVMHFLIWTSVFSGILTLIEQRFTLNIEQLLIWALVFSFSVFSPLIVTELQYFILLHTGTNVAPVLLSILYLLLLLLVKVILQKRNLLHVSRPLMFKRIWLIIACGLGIQTFYQPYGTAPAELFELANRATPLMEMHFFQVMPLLSKASSHFVSDYGFGILYEALYGYQGLDFLVFDVFENLIWIVVSYLLIHAITRKTLLAFYFVALFPFADAALSPYYILALIPLLILIAAWKNPAPRQAWFFGISVVLLMPWRADLAFALVFCLVGVLAISIWLKKIQFRFLLPMFISAIVFGMLLLGICLYKDIDWLRNLQCSIDYLSSSQSYGLTNMGDEHSISFVWQHFLLPLLVIACLWIALKEMLHRETPSRALIPWLIVLFLGIFYLVNLPRGIVRHGFAEGYDNFLSSFAFFLIPLTIAIQLPFRDAGRWMTWLGMLFVVMLFLRFPQRQPEPALMLAGINRPVHLSTLPTHLGQRLKINTAAISPDVLQLAQFLRNTLKSEETFLDFGNTPMLYFYAEKEVPAFFYQSPQNVHSLSLQKDWINRLEHYNVPILLFRHAPHNWWDETDGVPNELRHCLMAEYFYAQYSPWKIDFGYEIWKKKTAALEVSDTLYPEIEHHGIERFQLLKQPTFWRPKSQKEQELKFLPDMLNTQTLRASLPENATSKPALINFTIESVALLEKEAHFFLVGDTLDLGGFEFKLLPGLERQYVLRPSILWSWWKNIPSSVRIQLPDSVRLKHAIFASPND